MKFAPKTTIIAVSVAPMSKSMDERNLKVAETVASRITQFRTITVTARLNRLTNESAHYYFAPGRAAKYCNGRVCVSVCVFFPRAYLRNYTSDLHQIFCICTVAVYQSSFGPLRYVVCFRFYGWHHICNIMSHKQGCPCNTGTASQPEGAARRLGREPWLKQQAVSP